MEVEEVDDELHEHENVVFDQVRTVIECDDHDDIENADTVEVDDDDEIVAVDDVHMIDDERDEITHVDDDVMQQIVDEVDDDELFIQRKHV